MNPRLLHLKHRGVAQRPAVAWFLAGGDPVVWMEELIRWPGGQENLRLFVVPRSAVDREPGGLLVIPAPGSPPPQAPRALPLGVLADRLFLPVDAELFPPVTVGEVRELCRSDVAFFHPGLGLVQFAAEDARGLWDLFERPALAVADWNSAQAGITLHSRLTGVALLALPKVDDLFGDAAREIGAEPIVDLPPRPDEPSSNILGKMGRGIAGAGFEMVTKLMSLLPKTSLSRTWVNDVMDWAAAKLGGISREMEEVRLRELHRLLHLLTSDPERGLRHALPLGGSPGRGRISPGARLGNRDVGFQLNRLGGGAPADPWDVPWEIRQKLTEQYRELARREQQLGRFRRAAYIYAELLGDLNAAAAILKEGKHYAEAAVLYRDHLRQPLAAAECFAAGGLFNDAIAIYEKEGRLLELGDLHRRLENEEAAELAYRRVVEQKVAVLDFLGAAALLEERLRVPDEALALLGKAWPGAGQAALCLSAEFKLLGRLGRHEAAQRRVVALQAETTPPAKIIALAEILSMVRTTYPDASLRPLAADVARVKLSDRLLAGDASEVRAATRILTELAPEDRLLARDTSRFLAARLEALARRPSPPPLPLPARKAGSGRVGVPKPVREFSLPASTQVSAAKRFGPYFVAVFWNGDSAVFMNGDWNGNFQLNALGRRGRSEGPLSLILDEQAGKPDFVALLSPVHPGQWSGISETGSLMGVDPFSFGCPDWLPRDTFALSIGSVQWWSLRGTGDFILEVRQPEGQLMASYSLGTWIAEITERIDHLTILVMWTQVWLSIERQVLLFDKGTVARQWICESPVLGFEASALFLPRAVVARCSSGVAVFWEDHLSDAVEMLASDLVEPLATFLGNGCLAVLSTSAGPHGFAGQVIDIDRRRVHGTAEFSWEGAAPVALVATDRPNEFAIFTRKGGVQIMAVPVGG